ncbi:hypothetical protein QE152_g24292 [Popillia japonica]|uniref:Uncharacterized protein n=1 Tax=Popillia japonica TaxID=7064 RepID=A0AAW1KCS2_POPJA
MLNVKKLSRKKKKNRKTWRKNIRKEKRLKGEDYVGVGNVKHLSRPLLPSPCIDKPKHKCNSTVNETSKVQIYTEFRNLPTIDDQRQLVLNHVEQKPKKRTTRNLVNSRKTYSNYYYYTLEGDRKAVRRSEAARAKSC